MLGFVAIGGYIIAFNLVGPPSPKASAAPGASTHGKPTKPKPFRNSKAICGPVPKGFARCLAHVVTDRDGHRFKATPAISGAYGPTQFHVGYQLPCTPGGPVASICATPATFGPTVAIVDAGNLTTGGASVASSLAVYNQNYGLPACTAANGCLTVVNQTGGTSLPPSRGWDDEIALDVETVHMICQTCKIVLVESTTTSQSDMATAVNTAASFNPVAISNSYGVDNADTTSLDSFYTHPGIAVVASTGDSGAATNGVAWPADIPTVVAVSGTSLNLNNDSSWASETVWSGSGGGCNQTYAAPAWQLAIVNWGSNGCGTRRAFGDVSADANPATGAAVVIGTTWSQFGGTSLAAPIVAAIFGLVGKFPAGAPGSVIPYLGNNGNSANFHDIVSGSDCIVSGQLHCTASAGFDTPSGLGSPHGAGGFSPPPSAPTNPSTSLVDQTHINLTWTAATGNVSIASYDVYRNGVKIGSSASSTYNDSGLTPNTNYHYYVIAIDSLNNHSPASTTTPDLGTYAPADINLDGHINIFDFSIFASKYGQSGAGIGRSDLNGDGVVNISDLSLFALKYGTE